MSSATAAPGSIAAREDAKRRRVSKQSFDSPLKVKWSTPAPADLQARFVAHLAESVLPTTSAVVARGLRAVARTLQLRAQTPVGSKESVLLVVLFRGDLDLLAGPELYGWIPGLAQLAAAAGHQVELAVVTVPGAAPNASAALEKRIPTAAEAESVKRKPRPAPRLVALALDLDTSAASAGDVQTLLDLARQFPRPSVPFYDAMGDRASGALVQTWAAKLLPHSVKLLKTSAPLVDKKKQAAAKKAAEAKKAAAAAAANAAGKGKSVSGAAKETAKAKAAASEAVKKESAPATAAPVPAAPASADSAPAASIPAASASASPASSRKRKRAATPAGYSIPTVAPPSTFASPAAHLQALLGVKRAVRARRSGGAPVKRQRTTSSS
ncbi:hypothetical protein H9P43_002627 [Blastocladiella emersonii ATCC 22665]|nr:hypothetical protein H9P43_002627 [Blastocladiella emersonii ATCC 22665]